MGWKTSPKRIHSWEMTLLMYEVMATWPIRFQASFCLCHTIRHYYTNLSFHIRIDNELFLSSEFYLAFYSRPFSIFFHRSYAFGCERSSLQEVSMQCSWKLFGKNVARTRLPFPPPPPPHSHISPTHVCHREAAPGIFFEALVVYVRVSVFGIYGACMCGPC